jgi:hypothetical protein
MSHDNADLKQHVKILIPDNDTQIVTPERVRQALDLIIDSTFNVVSTGTKAAGNPSVINSDVIMEKKLFLGENEVTPSDSTNGVYKLNAVVNGDVVSGGNDYPITLSLPVTAPTEFSMYSNFPKSVKEAEAPGTPQTDPDAFIPYVYNAATQRWLDHQVAKQVNLWRVSVEYTRNNTNNNRELMCKLRNPDTGFEITQGHALLAGGAYQSFAVTFIFLTISSPSSSTDGYEFVLRPDGVNLTLNDVNITRTSLENTQP